MSTFSADDRGFAREKARIGREEVIFYVLSVVLLLAGLLAYTYPSIQTVHLVYREQELKSRERGLAAERDRLRMEFEMLRSPREMEARARAAGFAPVPHERLVFVRKK